MEPETHTPTMVFAWLRKTGKRKLYQLFNPIENGEPEWRLVPTYEESDHLAHIRKGAS